MRDPHCIFCDIEVKAGIKGKERKLHKGGIAHQNCFDLCQNIAYPLGTRRFMRMTMIPEILEFLGIPKDYIYHRSHNQ